MRFMRVLSCIAVLSLVAGAAIAANPTYTVKPGDTLMSIAREKLGASSRWQEIYDLNRDRLESPDRLKDGMRLRLPAATPPQASSSTPVARIAPTGAAPSATPQPSGIHIVQAGETLMSIARSRLGSESRWSDLYEQNREKMTDPNQLRAGMVLRLPPAPAPSATSSPAAPASAAAISAAQPTPVAATVAEAPEVSNGPAPAEPEAPVADEAPITVLTLPGNVVTNVAPVEAPMEPEPEPVITPMPPTVSAAPVPSSVPAPERISPVPVEATPAERPLQGSSIEPVSNDANQALARAREELLAARRQAGLAEATPAEASVPSPVTAPPPAPVPTPPVAPRATATVEVIPPPARATERDVAPVPTPAPVRPVASGTDLARPPIPAPSAASSSPAEARPSPRGPKVLVQPFDMRTGPGRDRDIGVAVYRSLSQGLSEEGRLARTAGEAAHHIMGEYWCSGENVTIRAWVQRRFTILRDFQWKVSKSDLAAGSPFYDTMRAEISAALSTL